MRISLGYAALFGFSVFLALVAFYQSPAILGTWILMSVAWIEWNLTMVKRGKGEWLDRTFLGVGLAGLLNTSVLYFLMPPLIPLLVAVSFLTMVLIRFVPAIMADEDVDGVGTAVGVISAVLWVILMAVIIVFPWLKAYDLHKIPPVEEVDNVTDLISTEHIRLVPIQTASWKAEKRLGKLGDVYATGEPHIQFRDGELKWLVPLEYRGLWQAWVYRNEGTPGYVAVSAEKAYSEPELVTGLSMKYIPTGIFSHNLYRVVYYRYPAYYIGELVFQLDDRNRPIYVAMLKTPTIALDGDIPAGIVVADPQTGDVTFYDMDSIPPYIQRVADEDLIESWLEWWGLYVRGFWNALLAQKDVIRPTGGIETQVDEQTGEIKIEAGEPDVFLVYGNDGKLYWFTAMAPIGKRNTMVGYVLADVKNPYNIKFYRTEGYYSDIGAAKNAQQHQEVSKVMGLRVAQPIMYVIEGNETWIIPVLTSSSEVRLIAIVHAKTGMTFVGESLEDAMGQYLSWLHPGKEVTEEEVQNVVAKVLIYAGDRLVKEIPVEEGQKVVIVPMTS